MAVRGAWILYGRAGAPYAGATMSKHRKKWHDLVNKMIEEDAAIPDEVRESPSRRMQPRVPISLRVEMKFDGSEDIAFDGQGKLVGKRGDELLEIDGEGGEMVLAGGIPKAYGLRYRSDGELVVALPNDGKVIAVSPEGEVSELAVGLQGPNGVYVDLMDRIWITEFAGSRVIRVEGDLSITSIVDGPEAEAANGVIYDPDRDALFFTNYQAGMVRRVDFDGGVAQAPVVLGVIEGKPDGLALDACGNLYVVDQGGSRLFRWALDPAGDPLGEATLVAEFATNVANASFGAGAGFEAESLYVAGNPGVVYRVDMMVPGAATPTVP